MIQYCCGDNCKDAGVGLTSSAKFRRALESRGGGGGGGAVYLKYANGTIIPPSKEGPMKVPGLDSEKRSVFESVDLLPRKDKDEGKCKDWKPDPDMKNDPYTKPAEETDMVYRGAAGGTHITITKTRSQSWTNGAEMSLSIADIIGFGTSISSSFTEEKSDSTSIGWDVPKDQDGDVAFTATLKCTRGEYPTISPRGLSLSLITLD